MCSNSSMSSQFKGDKDHNTALIPTTKTTEPLLMDVRFFLCGFIYLMYFTSLSIIGQFLSLFFQSKGFDGKVVGMLSSIIPLTSFLFMPIWGNIIARTNNNVDASTGKTVSLPLLYSTILISVVFQTSLAFVHDPWSMSAVKTLTGIFHGPVKPLLDAVIMDHVDKSAFGKVRLFGILGSGLGSFLGGKLLLHASTSDGLDSITDRGSDSPWIGSRLFSHFLIGYNILFLMHALLLIPTLMGIRTLELLEKPPQSSTTTVLAMPKVDPSPSPPHSPTQESPAVVSIPHHGSAWHVFQDLDHVLFFIVIYIMGTAGGVADAFTYPRFREVGCDTNQMGTSRMLCSIAGAVMFWYSGSFSATVGRENVLVISLVSVGIRFSLLRCMKRPLEGYIAEAVRGAIFGVFWSSSTIYASQIGPPSLRATMLLLLNGVYNGIGRSTGSLLGGKFQAEFGSEALFGAMAMIALSFALAMFIYQHGFRKLKTAKQLA